MKNRIVLSCFLALTLAGLGCETEFARPHDDVDDTVTSQTHAVEETPDAAPVPDAVPAPPGADGLGTSPSGPGIFEWLTALTAQLG